MIELSKDIFEYLTSLYGSESALAYKAYIQTEHTTYLRKKKNYSSENLINDLSEYGITVQQEPEIPDAYKIIKGENAAGKTIQHITGKYYIQSLSSMVPAMVLDPKEKDVVLDLCAAPGSKTTQLSDLMGNKGTLISNEISVDRVKMLVHNIDRMNVINIGVLNHKGELLSKVYSNYFDKILVDAPCSALGVLQKKQEVSSWWNEERVAVIASIQLKLLIAAIKMLKPGGELVYSTCTLTPEENEIIVNTVLRKYPVEAAVIEFPLESHEGFTSYKNERLHPDLKKAKRILPWQVDSEGFFVVKLRKTSETETNGSNTGKVSGLSFISSDHKSIRGHLAELSDAYGIHNTVWNGYKYLAKGTDLFFTAESWNDSDLSSFTRVGTRFGSIGKNNKLQLHPFAVQYFSDEIKENIYFVKDKNELRNYLAGGIIRTSAEPGTLKAVKYRDIMLGTAVPVHNGLKSQFPKSKRMQEIIL